MICLGLFSRYLPINRTMPLRVTKRNSRRGWQRLSLSWPTFLVAVRNSFTFFSNLRDATLQLWPNISLGPFQRNHVRWPPILLGICQSKKWVKAAYPQLHHVCWSQRRGGGFSPGTKGTGDSRHAATCWRVYDPPLLLPIKLQYPSMTCSRAGPCSNPLQCPDAACSTSFTSEWAPWFQASSIQVLLVIFHYPGWQIWILVLAITRYNPRPST